MNAFRWIKLAVSLLANMFCGIGLSFNVIALKMKSSFRLDQWQLELLASSLVMGWSFLLITAWVIKRFGYQVCYILALFLTISTSLLMWLSTQHVQFFKERIWLMCFFEFFNTAGTGGASQCNIAIGIQLFDKKHTGKVVGLYLASFGFAKIYYSFLFDIYFQHQESLGTFFLTLAASLGSSILLCYFLHRVPARDNSTTENTSLIDSSGETGIPNQNTSTTNESEINDNIHQSQLRTLLTSPFFVLTGVCFVLFQSSTLTFMNNVTSFAASVGEHNPHHFIYILAVVLVIARLMFGACYDYFGSFLCGMVLMYVAYILFCVSMLISLFWLNSITIYIMVVLASVGCGAGYSLPLAMLSSEFGPSNYPLILGLVNSCLCPVILAVHVAAGWTYENDVSYRKSPELFCKECFNGTYFILLGCTIFVSILQIVNSIIYVKLDRERNQEISSSASPSTINI